MKVEARCPAATLLAGPSGVGPSVICRAMIRDEVQTDQILHGQSATPLVTAGRDPSTLFGFCCGAGVPRATEDYAHSHGHYSFCPVWELEQKRIAQRKKMMAPPKQRGSALGEAEDSVFRPLDPSERDPLADWLAKDAV